MRSWITVEPIETAAVLAEVGAAADGAVLLFLGVVRDHNEGESVVGIRYEAYSAMAERVLAEITREAAARLGTERIAVAHSIGELAVGETSVAIAVSSPHRAEAFDAARYTIEEIKRRLPIWKEEQYREGEPRWLDGQVPAPAGTGGGRTGDDAG
jgi:molybdopterin synthase catalytic subunit